MSFKVVHIVDYYIQETMNWLEELLHSSKEDIEHYIAADFFNNESHSFKRVNGFGFQSDYPPGILNKVKSKIKHSHNIDLLTRFIQSEKIDAIHFHFGHMAIRYSRIFSSVSCKKFVSLYGFDYEYLVKSQPGTLQNYQYLASHGAEFIVEGSYSKNLLESYQIPSRQIRVVQMFYQRNASFQYNQWRSPISLFQAATYTEKKGHLVLLEALSKCHNNNFYTLQCNGEVVDKNYYLEMQKIIRINKLNNVILGSKIRVKQYIEQIRQSHIIVCLSKKASSGDTEGGCPVIIKDAFSMSKPVFTTHHCDIPDIASHNFNSWTIKENNVSEAVEVLNQLQALSNKEYKYFCNSAYETSLSKTRAGWTRLKLLETYFSK